MGKDVTYLEYEGRHSLFGPMPRGVGAKDFMVFLTRRPSKESYARLSPWLLLAGTCSSDPSNPCTAVSLSWR